MSADNDQVFERCERLLAGGLQFALRAQHGSGGFPRDDGENLDPWTTAELVLAIRSASSSTEEVIVKAVTFLQGSQLSNGSWQSSSYNTVSKGRGDVAATAYAIRALVWAGLSPSDLSIVRARDWLLGVQRADGGWAVGDAPEPFSHVGLSGYAISALALCPPWDHLTAEGIQRGLYFLNSTKLTDGGWPFRKGASADMTMSCYALRAILDAFVLRGYEPRVHDVVQWLELARRKQSPDGSWSDWYGVGRSVEATAYVIEIVSTLFPDDFSNFRKDAMVNTAFHFLERVQNEDGGHAIFPNEKSSLWVTHNVMLALASLLRRPTACVPRAPSHFLPSILGAQEQPSTDHYDVSISFASEHRDYAEVLAFRLMARGLSVFYDRFDPQGLWGARLPEVFERVYARDSDFCVLLMSEEYLKRPWPMFELRQMQSRLVFENRDTILPIIMSDAVEPPDYLRMVGFLRASEVRLDEVVSFIVEKVKKPSHRR